MDLRDWVRGRRCWYLCLWDLSFRYHRDLTFDNSRNLDSLRLTYLLHRLLFLMHLLLLDHRLILIIRLKFNFKKRVIILIILLHIHILLLLFLLIIIIYLPLLQVFVRKHLSFIVLIFLLFTGFFTIV